MSEVLLAEQYCGRLLESLHSLQESDTLCDLTLMAENQPIRVHRTVMAAGSDYFRALLTLEMKEKGQKVVTLKGVTPRGLKEVVKFAYSGKLFCTFENISDVLLAATHLQFPEAVSLCSMFLTSLTSNVNSIDMYNIAEQFNLVPLKEHALGLILCNFGDVAKREDFLRFSPRFLSDILADNRLKAFSELKLFHLVLQWINYDKLERTKCTYQLMSNIRFPLIPPADMVDIVMNEPIMKADSQCLELILEANKFHMLPHKQPLVQNNRTQVRSDVPNLVMLDVDDDGPRIFDLVSRTWGGLRYNRVETFHAQVCVLDNYMYVCGGIELYSSNNPVSSKCYRYDPRFDTWSEIAPMREPRHHFTLVADSRSIFAIGGYSNGVFKSVVEQYVLQEDKWVIRAPLDTRLSAAAAAVYRGRIYVTGGQSDKGILRSTWCYQMGADVWCHRAPLVKNRMDHAMCCYGKKIFAVGGYDKNIIKAFDVNTVECYDVITNQWCTVFENAPKISGISSCLIGCKLYVVGGFTYDENKKRSEVWSYNFDSSEWQVVARIHAPAMSVPCCALYLPGHNETRDVTV